LAGESDVTAAEVRDGLRRVTIQCRLCGHAVLRRIFAVVALIVEWRGDALVIGRNGARAKRGAALVAPAMVNLRNGIGLYEVLRRVADVVDDAEIRLQNR